MSGLPFLSKILKYFKNYQRKIEKELEDTMLLKVRAKQQSEKSEKDLQNKFEEGLGRRNGENEAEKNNEIVSHNLSQYHFMEGFAEDYESEPGFEKKLTRSLRASFGGDWVQERS